MDDLTKLAHEHAALTRRYFLGLSAAGLAGLHAAPAFAQGTNAAALAEIAASLDYLTKDEDFTNYGRGKPPPHTLPPEKLREVGLTRETWQLEVVPDPDSDAKVETPLSKERGTALDWSGLMKLAETRAVRILAVMTCTNNPTPCGMGLWEGVPLRDVVWMANPTGNVRRTFYYGYHNDDPEQRFQGSLPIGRVLEDPPGEHPVLICYKLNGRWLTPKRGGPARILVPGAYGNKSVKWLQRVVLTNNSQANDTYAEWNNDTVSHLKTYARFVNVPKQHKAGEPMAITGVAQVGMSGLNKVQYWLRPEGTPLPEYDPHFAQGDWRDADILPIPERMGGGLPGDRLPELPRQIDADTGKPKIWPLRYTLAHWAALVPDLPAGRYELRCRTIDTNGAAQPMPRPLPKGGNNKIQSIQLVVDA